MPEKSTIDPSLGKLYPEICSCFPILSPEATDPNGEHRVLRALIRDLKLVPHMEGGYYVQTDRSPLRIANPFGGGGGGGGGSKRSGDGDRGDSGDKEDRGDGSGEGDAGDADATRAASSSILYLLTAQSPAGRWHRNRGRTVHGLHWGRARYILIYLPDAGEYRCEMGKAEDAEDEREQRRKRRRKMKGEDEGVREGEVKGKSRIETFVVGKDVAKGERVQWVVEGGVWKACFLMKNPEEERSLYPKGFLISETVIPGFEDRDHEFLTQDRLKELLQPEQAEELKWLLKGQDHPIAPEVHREDNRRKLEMFKGL